MYARTASNPSITRFFLFLNLFLHRLLYHILRSGVSRHRTGSGHLALERSANKAATLRRLGPEDPIPNWENSVGIPFTPLG